MRRGRDKNQMARLVCSYAAQQLESLLAASPDATSQCAAVGFVHNHELRTLVHEVFSSPCGLDEVGRDDREAMPVEHGDAHVEITLKTLNRAAQYELRLDMKLLG